MSVGDEPHSLTILNNCSLYPFHICSNTSQTILIQYFRILYFYNAKYKNALFVSQTWLQLCSLICFQKIFSFFLLNYDLPLHAMKCWLSCLSAAASCLQVPEPMLFKLQLLLIKVSMTDKSLLHASLFYPWELVKLYCLICIHWCSDSTGHFCFSWSGNTFLVGSFLNISWAAFVSTHNPLFSNYLNTALFFFVIF